MVESDSREPVAWRGLALLAGGFVALLIVFSGRYGYHRDELYFLAIGSHPDWGYVDQPPLIPLLAHAMDAAFGHSLVLLRLPAAIAGGCVVLVTGLIARELGSRRPAQLFAAACMAVSSIAMAGSHLATTTAYDLLVWTLLSWLLVHAIRDDGRIWLAVGLVADVGLEVKTLVVFLLFGVTVGLIVAGPRSVFRSRWPYVAALIAVALWLPNLLWQAANGWPQLDLARAIAAGDSGTSDSPLAFVLLQLGLISPVLVPVWAIGWWRLARDNVLSTWRCFAAAYAVLFVVYLTTGGKAYYIAGLYPVLLAAGAQPVLAWASRRRIRRRLLGVALAFSLVAASYLFLPVVPAPSVDPSPISAVNYDAGEQIGWPEFADTIESAYADLTSDERAHAIFLGGNYGETGAVLRYAPGIPAYGVHNSLWDLGPPPAYVDTAIVVGWNEEELSGWCDDVQQVATIENDAGVDNDEDGTPVYACRGLRSTWAEIWPDLRRLG